MDWTVYSVRFEKTEEGITIHSLSQAVLDESVRLFLQGGE